MRQSDWTTSLQQAWTAAFGSNVNLDPRSNNGQLINIMAERLALVCEGVESVYAASFPGGAEGVAVDNLLALNGLIRLPARATVTQPTPLVQASGVTLYGLVLFGTAGTVIPAGSQVSDNAQPPHVLSLDGPVTIAAAANCAQQIILSNTPTSGAFALQLVDSTGATLTTVALSYQAQANTTLLTWPGAPTSGSFTLTAGSAVTPAQPYNVTASALAAALNMVLGTSTVTVTGSVAAGMVVAWGGASIPLLMASGDPAAPVVVNPVQAAVNALSNPATSLTPFADVAVAAQSGFLLSFGAMSPPTGQPSSAAQAVRMASVVNNTLQAGTTVTNVTVSMAQQGAPAQGIGTATGSSQGSTVTASIAAGAIGTIVTPVAGWTGVTNQLDCIPGATIETDSEALLRRSQLLAAQARGPLAALLQSVSSVSGVTGVSAYANSTGAAQQLLTVGSGAAAGSFSLYAAGATTGAIPYSPNAGQVQAALAALPGLGGVTVTGNLAYGFTVDWGGAMGGQAIPLMALASNTTGVSVTVSYGRAPKSVEVVVSGGSNAAVGAAIYAAVPSGITTYGTPVLVTTGQVVAGTPSVSVASTSGLSVGLAASGYGIQPGTLITAISGNTVTLAAPALSSYSNAQLSFGNAAVVLDANKNPMIVAFSRPQLVPIYVALSLVTDQYVLPGNAASGRNLNAQWTPTLVSQLQQEIVANIAAVPVGGLLVAQGSNGLLACFRDVPGVVGFTLSFGTTPSPTNTANIQLLPQQDPYSASNFITVSYT